MRTLRRSIECGVVAILLATTVALGAPGPLSASAKATRYDVIAETFPKIVKLYGAGGYRELDAYGTGFLVSADGLIATSWSTLLDAGPVTAVLDDGRQFPARLVAADTSYGLALLKIDVRGGPLPHFELDDPQFVEPGTRVFAFSNMFQIAAGGEPASVVHGSIIAHAAPEVRRGRYDFTFPEPVYLIDAVTNNPGAAGGAIVSVNGEFLGMIGREVRGLDTETWINYALTAPVVAKRIKRMRTGVEPDETEDSPAMPEKARRAVNLGLVLVPNVSSRTPAFVTDVLSNSPGQQAGFQRGDLILFVAGEATRSIDEVARALSQAEPGARVPIVVRRNKQLETLTIEIPLDGGS